MWILTDFPNFHPFLLSEVGWHPLFSCKSQNGWYYAFKYSSFSMIIFQTGLAWGGKVWVSRGSHIDVTCRSVCIQDQNGIKQWMFLLGANQGIKTNSEWLISTPFLTYLAGVATFCPLNSHRIKPSRVSEWSDQEQSRSPKRSWALWVRGAHNINEVI